MERVEFRRTFTSHNFVEIKNVHTMNEIKSILIIEDDTAISLGLKDTFTEELYDVTVIKDGKAGLTLALARPFGCIILDLMLPSMNGREVCKALRAAGSTTPILMLTSKSAESDVILGLEIGADDYMTKPFSIRELIARVRALIRRNYKQPDPILEEPHEFKIGNNIIDFETRELISDGSRQLLLIKEVEILQYFLKNEGKIISRETFLNEIWGFEHFPTTRSVDNFILRLRKKIEVNPAEPKHILTVRNSGYRFVLEV